MTNDPNHSLDDMVMVRRDRLKELNEEIDRLHRQVATLRVKFRGATVRIGKLKRDNDRLENQLIVARRGQRA